MLVRARSFAFAAALSFQVFGQAQETPTMVTSVEPDKGVDSMMYGSQNGNFDAGLKIGGGYYTNPFLLSSDLKLDSGNWTLRMKPRLHFIGEGKLAKLEVGVKALLDLIFGSQEATQLLVNGKVFAKGEINPNGSATMAASQSLRANSAVESLYVGSLTQMKSDTQFGVKLRPGDGPITIDAGAQVINKSYFNIATSKNTTSTAYLNALSNQTYLVNGKLAWEFAEDASLYVASKWGIWYGDAESAFVTSHPFAINAGIKAQLASNLRGKLSAGYERIYITLLQTNTLLDSASINLSASGRLDWKISDDSDFSLKISRYVSPSSVFLETWTNSFKLSFRQRFADNFVLLLAPAISWYEYGKPLTPNGSTRLSGSSRDDILLTDNEELSYFATDWLSFGIVHQGNYRWTNASSLDILQGQIATATGSFSAGITNDVFLAYLGIRY